MATLDQGMIRPYAQGEDHHFGPGSNPRPRWFSKVSGPLPGRPAERGEFVTEVNAYGDRPG
jgi:hypothetical protein